MYLYAQMLHMPDDQAWNVYSIALLGLIWCKFCIISRRLHDTGSNGFIAVPLLLIVTVIYLCLIDPNIAGPKELQDESVQALLAQGMRLPRVLLIVCFLYCIRAGGESGPNGFGPEFGDSADDMSKAGKAIDGSYDSTLPVHSFKKLGKDDDNGWGRRKRPAGFGRR